MKRSWIFLLFGGMIGAGYALIQILFAIPQLVPPVMQPNTLSGTLHIEYTIHQTFSDPLTTAIDNNQTVWQTTGQVRYDLSQHTVEQRSLREEMVSNVYPAPNGRYTAHLIPTGDYAFYQEKQAWLAQHPFTETIQFEEVLTQYLNGLPVENEDEMVRYVNGRSSPEYSLQIQDEAGQQLALIPIGSLEPAIIRWSPDSQHIAIAINDEMGRIVVRYHLATQTLLQKQWQGDERSPRITTLTWSQDSMYLAVKTYEELNVLDEANNVLLAHQGTTSDISWSNGKLRFRQTPELFVWEASSQQKVTIPTNLELVGPHEELQRYVMRPVSWSPDNQYAIYSGHSTGDFVWLTNLQTEETQIVYERTPVSVSEDDPKRYLAPFVRFFWSPDGSQVAFVNQKGQIVMVTVATGETTVLTDSTSYYPSLSLVSNTHALAWSPNGRYIAFPSFYEFTPDEYSIDGLYLYIIDTTTGDMIRSPQTIPDIIGLEERAFYLLDSGATARHSFSQIKYDSEDAVRFTTFRWEMDNES